MQPIPEVRDSLDRLSALLGDGMDLREYLDSVAKVAEALVPSCVGVSITVVVDGEPYTVASTKETLRPIDAAQNLAGGPCTDAMSQGEAIEVPDILDEEHWRTYRAAVSPRGIRSSLSLPLHDDAGEVTGGMNIYSAELAAFENNRALLATAFGADLSEAVTNADLGFMTRDLAAELPQRLEAQEKVQAAIDVLASTNGWSEDEARTRVRRAADLAGAELEELAVIVLSLSSEDA